MVEEVVHWLSERLGVIRGYKPAHWCAVCGLRADTGKDKYCVDESFSDLCLLSYPDEDTEFSCSNTRSVRAQASISALVAFTTKLPLSDSPSPFLTQLGSMMMRD